MNKDISKCDHSWIVKGGQPMHYGASEKVCAKCGLGAPAPKDTSSSDAWVEEVLEDFKNQFAGIRIEISSGDEVALLVIPLLRSFLCEFIEKRREEEKVASVEFIAEHKDDWKKEGATVMKEAVLKALPKEIPRLSDTAHGWDDAIGDIRHIISSISPDELV